MKISFVVISTIIIFLAIDLRLKIYLQYNILENIGRLKIKLFNITIFSRAITVGTEYFDVVSDKKVIKIKLNFTDKDIKIIKETLNYYKKKIYFISFSDEIFLSTNNPFVTTMIVGGLRSVGGSVISYVSANNPHLELNHKVYAGFVENNMCVNMNAHFMINLFDLIWSIFKVVYRRSVAIYER